ncbi:glycogen synthase [Leptolyngbya sp. 7M]|uniref:glycogen synthase n=1 Tax=Leptolyngbya sp. 7M TaxID=2812896 RepID=UPI001B8CCB7C|nr:glycogen/starch synthase [Leptolyngbya sp. 7M]QYO68265.1 glycogen synthase [Leptolyngbya sp. 7M]
MRVAVISAEAVPYSKTGGLGDVAGALPKALKNIGIDSVLITPCYWQTKGEFLWETAIRDLNVEWRGGIYPAKAFYSEANGSPTFLIDAPSLFHRDSIYGYLEDHERFAFFNKAALVLLRRIGRAPDIVHLNDWHCGFAAVELAERRRWDTFWQRTRTVFSIHNMAYQGAFGLGELWKLGFGSGFARDRFSFDGHASAMKAGLETSDTLSTVSRRYGFEIQTSEYGYGLEWLTRKRADRLIGITNGVDYEVWNPATDPELPANYDINDLSGKRECKRAMLERFSLPIDLERPVLANITRLTAQKGIDLMMQVVGEVLAAGAYIISLGSGEKKYEDFWQSLRDHAPNQVGIYRGYSEPLAHLIEAGADMFMMPSKFEPCGLNQMYSLRYGTVPIVRAVGGLDDTVQNWDAVSQTGNGFKFGPYAADAFLEKIYEALFAYGDKDLWQKIQHNGMSVDNSWENAARKYVSLYRWTLDN